MSGRTRGYAHRVDIAARPALVWKTLTDTVSLRKWCSTDARITARQGGQFCAAVDRVTELEALIDVFLPERRMRLIYLPAAGLPTTGSALVDDFLLDGTDAPRTVLRLLGSGYSADHEWDALYLRMRNGWERAVARLKVLVEQAGQADQSRPEGT